MMRLVRAAASQVWRPSFFHQSHLDALLVRAYICFVKELSTIFKKQVVSV